jgi:hypothetical protein
MLNMTRRSRLRAFVATALTAAGLAVLISAASAYADPNRGWEEPVTLSGAWAPFNRCPVDNPLMLAADGEANIALCLAVNARSGSITIGNLTVATEDTNTQLGISRSSVTGSSTVVAQTGGALVAKPIEIPGGLRAMICPSLTRFAHGICRNNGRGINTVTATLVSAGEPYNFDLFAGIELNKPIVSLPVKIHLQNPLLGRDCYIGSDEEPIVIQPENLTISNATFEKFDSKGMPDPNGVITVIQFGGNQASNSFAVPAASGCGPMDAFDAVINAKAGLPSPAGNNKIVLNEVTHSLVGLSGPKSPNDGKELSQYWHAAVEPGQSEEGDGSGFDRGFSGGGKHWSGHELEEGIRRGFRHGG